jgi:hypothetical protein
MIFYACHLNSLINKAHRALLIADKYAISLESRILRIDRQNEPVQHVKHMPNSLLNKNVLWIIIHNYKKSRNSFM